MSKALTATLNWNAFKDTKPPSVYENFQLESKVPYFVGIGHKQSALLLWHSRQALKPRWLWPNGTCFHGDVLYWATPPDSP